MWLSFANVTCSDDTNSARDFTLRAALSEYIRHHDKDVSWAKFNIERVTWEDVADELEKVEAIYQDKEIGNPIRKAFRRSAAYTTTAAPLLEAIPNDDGLGILKGAVLVVLKVWTFLMLAQIWRSDEG